MSATLGGLIKDYRIQRGIQQLEIAYKIGWKDATILSRIEQGVTKTPSREVIDKICSAMELEEEEKNNLLYVGSYVPTSEEINNIRNKMDPIINNYLYPILIEDFTWRVVHENEAARHLEYKDENEAKWVDENLPNALEYNFQEEYHNAKFPKNIKEEDKIEFLTAITAQFLSEQKERSNQRWYKDLMTKLMRNPRFRNIYQTAIKIDTSTIVRDYSKQTVAHRRNPNKILSYFMFNVPLMTDARFFLEFQVPADIETFKYYEEYTF